MSDEIKISSIYKIYSRDNCLLGKSIFLADQKHQCKLSYSLFPTFSKKFRPCSLTMVKNIIQEINSEKFVSEADKDNPCMNACQYVTYTLDVESTKPSNEELISECRSITRFWRSSDKTFYSIPLLFYEDYWEMIERRQEIEDPLYSTCRILMRNTAKVTIESKGLLITTIHKHRRVTFISQLAGFGKKFFIEYINTLNKYPQSVIMISTFYHRKIVSIHIYSTYIGYRTLNILFKAYIVYIYI